MGRHREVDLCEVLNAIFYVFVIKRVSMGDTAHDFPPKSTVYEYYSQWRKSGDWQRIHAALHQQIRVQVHKEPTPSAVRSIANPSKRQKKGAEGL